MNHRHWLLLPAGMLLLAPAPLPYDYYTLLRFVVSPSAGYLAFLRFKGASKVDFAVGISLLIALIFNPLLPVYLSRPVWFIIDLAVAAWFGFAYFRRGLI